MTEPLVPVIGSITRAYSLAVLAGTRVPLTAYRIAKLANLSAPNVYLELRRLASAGIVQRGESGWVLVDDRVRSFCEGQGPLFERRFSLDDKRRRNRKGGRWVPRQRRQTVPSGDQWFGAEPRLMREFTRPPTKDTLLRRTGLKPSRHGRK
jgi:DNA-binding transcriptional ArsR family regulator